MRCFIGCFLLVGGWVQAESWVEVPRDIYIDGQLDRTCRWFSGKESQLFVPRDGRWAIRIEGKDQEYRLSKIPKSKLQQGDKIERLKIEGQANRVVNGTFYKTGDRHYVLHYGRNTVVVSAHQGPEGPLTESKIYQAMPLWQQLKVAYEPSDDALANLRKINQPIEVAIHLGTWCGDSRNLVPKLLRTFELANNSNLKVSLHGISSDFSKPADAIRQHSITNVPTMIVSREGEEIGRLVERKVGDTIEGDLTLLLSEQFDADFAKYKAEELMAKGVITHQAGAGPVEESWWLLRGKDERRTLKSRSIINGEIIEVRLSTDENHRARFLERTIRGDGYVRRTRIYGRKGRWSAVTRASDSGIVRQSFGRDLSSLIWQTGSAAIDAWLLQNKDLDVSAIAHLSNNGTVLTPNSNDALALKEKGQTLIHGSSSWHYDARGLLLALKSPTQRAERLEVTIGPAWEETTEISNQNTGEE